GNPKKGIRGFHHDDRRAFAGETVRLPHEPTVSTDGQTRILDTVKMPLRDEVGAIHGVLCFARDVTAEWEAEQRESRS
ncbi:MAG: PAS domain-containing protein, partial [Polyangiaceae bacterium]|nr:PAS domain-containing protein [Polyangiaceae bacterium]